MARLASSAADFVPPHCPNPNCRHHRQFDDRRGWKRAGFFPRLAAPHRIQRFTCLTCRRSFSSQTFASSYWQKLPRLDHAIFMKAVGGMANRQIARDLRVAPSTIDRHLARLGRHCLLFHRRIAARARLQGDLVIDGFESFEYSQFFPFLHHQAVEAQSGFFWHFTDSPLRRKGRMTAAQRRRREQLEHELGRPDPKAVEHDTFALLSEVIGREPRATLRSDDHQAYPRAIRRLGVAVEHRITSSRERRDAHNPLFEINLLDLMIRHSQANHRRETIAWSKRRQGSAERLAILLVWRNYVKWRWEKRCRQTPAMIKGLLSRRLQVEDVLRRRIFRTHLELPTRWGEYYDRTVRTVALPVNRRHTLSYAY